MVCAASYFSPYFVFSADKSSFGAHLRMPPGPWQAGMATQTSANGMIELSSHSQRVAAELALEHMVLEQPSARQHHTNHALEAVPRNLAGELAAEARIEPTTLSPVLQEARAAWKKLFGAAIAEPVPGLQTTSRSPAEFAIDRRPPGPPTSPASPRRRPRVLASLSPTTHTDSSSHSAAPLSETGATDTQSGVASSSTLVMSPLHYDVTASTTPPRERSPALASFMSQAVKTVPRLDKRDTALAPDKRWAETWRTRQAMPFEATPPADQHIPPAYHASSDDTGGTSTPSSDRASVRAEVVITDSPWPSGSILQTRLENLVRENRLQAEMLKEYESLIAQHGIRTNLQDGLNNMLQDKALNPAIGELKLSNCKAPTADFQPANEQLDLNLVKSERDALRRGIQQLEEALKMRNDEVRHLVHRTQELETRELQWKAASGTVQPPVTAFELAPKPKSPKWEERIMGHDNWEQDIACQWINVMWQSVQAMETLMHDFSRMLKLKSIGEEGLKRQIRHLNGRLLELQGVHEERGKHMNQILEECEFLGKAHIQILENDLRAARNKAGIFCEDADMSFQHKLSEVLEQYAQRQKDQHNVLLISSMHACAGEVASQGGVMAILDQCGRALATAWVAIQERDAKIHMLHSLALQDKSIREGNRSFVKDKQDEVERLQRVIRDKDELLKNWMRRYDDEISDLQTVHGEAEAELRQENASLKAQIGSLLLSEKAQSGQMKPESLSIDKTRGAGDQSPMLAPRAKIYRPPSLIHPDNMLSVMAKVGSISTPHASPAQAHSAHTPPRPVNALSPRSEQVEWMRRQNQYLESMLLSHRDSSTQQVQHDETDSPRVGASVTSHVSWDSIPSVPPLQYAGATIKTGTEPQSTVMRLRVAGSPCRTRPPRGIV